MEEKKINNKFEHVEKVLKYVIKYVDFLKEEIVVDMLTTEYEYEHSARIQVEEMIKDKKEMIKDKEALNNALEEIKRLIEILKSNNIRI